MPLILIVDDHSIVRTGLKLLLENLVPLSRIEEAYNGDSAFEKIKETNYDLVVMDVNMPQTDSFGTLQTILTLKPSIKIIMFSMNSEEVYAKRYLKIGAKGYLRKDSSNHEIEKAINTVLNGKIYVSSELTEKLVTNLQFKKENDNPFDKLSPREFEIARHIARGESVSEISGLLHIHTSTVGTYKTRIFDKLQIKNLVELINLAKAHNIIFSS